MRFKSPAFGLILLVIATAATPLLRPQAGRAQVAPPQNAPAPPSRLAEAEKAYAGAQRQREELADRLAGLREEIANATHQVEVSPDGLRRAIEKLQEQQEQLQLDEAGAQGRRQGLEQAIKEYTESVANRATSDDAVKEYKRLVEIRTEQLQRIQTMYKQGAAPASEVSNAEVAVAQAQADLATAKQRAAGETGPNGALDAWNREAMNLSIEQAERRARLQYIQSRLDKYNQVMPKVLELDQLAAELRNAEERQNRVRLMLDGIGASTSNTSQENANRPPQP